MKGALTGHCHTNDGAQTAIQQKRLSKRLSTSDLPAASRLWTNGTPRQSTEWRLRDRKLFNHSISALESLESNGDRRNYLSSWEENVERRLAVVSEGPASAETRSPGFWTFRRSDLWIGPLRWAHLASSSASVHPCTLRRSSRVAGVKPRLASLHARLPSICICICI